MKERMLLIAGLLLLPVLVSAENRPEIWADSAANAYRSGDYNQSVIYYKKILSEGLESPALYYNLGNACYKAGDMASAILYYERSLKLRPGDEDAGFNLKVARSRIIDKIDEVPAPFYTRAYRTVSHWMNADSWAVLVLLSLLFLMLCLALFLSLRKVSLRKTAFSLGLLFMLTFILSNFLACSRYHDESGRKGAVVFVPTLHVKSCPDEKSTDVFVIHEGTRVEIRDRIGDWYEIRIANGNMGWILAESVEVI